MWLQSPDGKSGHHDRLRWSQPSSDVMQVWRCSRLLDTERFVTQAVQKKTNSVRDHSLYTAKCKWNKIWTKSCIFNDIERGSVDPTLCFKNVAKPGLFFVYFRLFKSNIVTNFTTNHCEKMSCQSSIWQRDSNPRHSEHEPPPITTRPGLPPAHSLFIGYQTPGGSYESCLCIQWTF